MIQLQMQRILIVEDEPLIAFCLEDFLREMGVSAVEVAPTCAAARECIRSKRPTCVLLDVVLTDGSGFEVADRLVELDIPFIFTTGIMPADIPRRFRDRQFCGKPVNYEDLAMTIRRAAALHNLACTQSKQAPWSAQVGAESR